MKAATKSSNAVFLLLAFCVIDASLGLYDSNSPVIQFNNVKDFEEQVIKSDDAVWLVEFYAPWCGHCKALAPAYSKVAKNLKGVVKVAAVDVDATKEFAGMFGIQSFPTIKLFPPDTQLNPYTKQISKTPMDYQGPRTGKALAEFATAQIPSFVTAVSSEAESWSNFQTLSTQAPSVILFSNKKDITPLYKSLSLKFKGRVNLVQARDTDEKLCADFGVTEFPSVVAVSTTGEREKFEGTVGADTLTAFIEARAPPKPASSAKEPEEAKKSAKPELAVCAAEEFDQKVLEVEELYLVAFVRKGDSCDADVEAAASVIGGLAGMVKSCQVVVDDDNSKLAAFWGAADVADKKSCVQLALFPFGSDKADADAEIYEDEMQTKPLQNFVTESMPNFVERINADNLQQFLNVQMHMPKILLFSKKEDIPGTFKALALNFRTPLLYGFVSDAESPELAQQFQVKKFPSVIMTMVQQAAGPNGEASFAIQPYSGPLTYAALANFVGVIAQQFEQQRHPEEEITSDSNADLSVQEVTTGAELDAACVSKGGLCLVAMLDSNHANLDQHIQVLHSIAHSRRSQPLSIIWINTPRQAEFARWFEIGTTDIPTVAVLSPRKLRYALLRGAFTVEEVEHLIQGVFSAKISTNILQEMPKLVDGGADPIEESMDDVVEDEFDLSDIMDEEIEIAAKSKEDIIKEAEQQMNEEKERKRLEEEEAKAAAAAAEAEKKTKKKRKNKKKSKKAANEDL